MTELESAEFVSLDGGGGSGRTGQQSAEHERQL